MTSRPRRQIHKGRLEECAGVYLEFGFSQSFQGEPVVREVRASARVYTSQGGLNEGSSERRGDGRGGGEGSLSGTLFLFLRGTSAHLPMFPLVPLTCPLRVFVPLNKLVRFNDSYFFLVTRLPSFAPTRRLRKVAVNLVPSMFPTPLSLSHSPFRPRRITGIRG